jgi:3'-phosphoadenosine 5'-phosphosulfate (PAPS) 3'-phosphatase
VGYKVGQILLGRAHLYLHAKRGTTWWDTVAPAAVFRAAGGEVADKIGRPLRWANGIEHRDGFLFTVPGLGRPATERLLD